MESPADDIQLLLPGQLDEIHRVAGYPDSKLGIKLRMLHSVKQNISIQNIYVDVVAVSDLGYHPVSISFFLDDVAFLQIGYTDFK